jgi:hypothetical protein
MDGSNQDVSSRPEVYRARARRLRAAAERTLSSYRQDMLKIAEQYEALADEICGPVSQRCQSQGD